MHIYKIKFKADDLKYNYMVDMEVLGKDRDQAVQLASDQAQKILCSSRIDEIKPVGKRVFFGKPRVMKISENCLVSKH